MENGRDDCKHSDGWHRLPAPIQLHILSLLPPNELALTIRRVSRGTRDTFNEPQHFTASLSQPLPAYTKPWAQAEGQQHVRQLPFQHKLQLLCTAAASGCKVNLGVALSLLKPSVFPEMLYNWRSYSGPDPGVSAVKAGHPQLLGWLLLNCPGLMCPGKVLAAAAQHCDLAGLQTAWEALRYPRGSSSSSNGSSSIPNLIAPAELLHAAAESVTPDSIAKMEWVVATAGGSGRMRSSLAEAAARSGELSRLRWLRDRGCPVGLFNVLETALGHADLAVAQWLVDEAGCRLPAAGSGDVGWKHLFQAAAKSPDHLAKWKWLQEQGAPSLHEADREWVAEVALAAARAGQVGAVRHLLSVFGADRVLGEEREAFERAVAQSGSVETVACLRGAGLELSSAAYGGAALSGCQGLPLMRWLAREAGVSAAGMSLNELRGLIDQWPSNTPADSRGLLEAVQLLVGNAGFCNWHGTAFWVFLTAADRGDLPLLHYLLTLRSTVWQSVFTVQSAAKSGCEVLCEWLAQNAGSSFLQPECASPYLAAAARGDRATLTLLRRVGVPWGETDTVARGARCGCAAPALRWLVEQRAPLGGTQELEGAVASAVECWGMGAEDAAWLRGVAAGASRP